MEDADDDLALVREDAGQDGADGFAIIAHDRVDQNLLSTRNAAIIADASRDFGPEFSGFVEATIRAVNGVSECVVLVRAATTRSHCL